MHAYLHRTPDLEGRLRAVQQRLREEHRIPVAIEYGPALQHSTGQYYKGGMGDGLVVQVTEEAAVDLPIPGRPYGFGGLLSAQSRGDAEAMISAGRAVIRTSLADLEAAASRTRMLEATCHESSRFSAFHAQPGSTRVTRVETTRLGRVTPRQSA